MKGKVTTEHSVTAMPIFYRVILFRCLICGWRRIQKFSEEKPLTYDTWKAVVKNHKANPLDK